jgi:hypothetical protein
VHSSINNTYTLCDADPQPSGWGLLRIVLKLPFESLLTLWFLFGESYAHMMVLLHSSLWIEPRVQTVCINSNPLTKQCGCPFHDFKTSDLVTCDLSSRVSRLSNCQKLKFWFAEMVDDVLLRTYIAFHNFGYLGTKVSTSYSLKCRNVEVRLIINVGPTTKLFTP